MSGVRRRKAWLALLGFPAALGAAGPGGDAPARTLAVTEPAFRDVAIVVATSMPPQFELVLVRDMPTTGWTCVADAVEVDAATGRIVARLTERGPAGAAAQVVTATPCRVPLGKLARGRWLVELWLRRGADGRHTRVQALVVDAR
jgi:hypothetical protein